MRSGVVVLDRELRVLAWNHRADDLWGLRAAEVKRQNFLNLDKVLTTALVAANKDVRGVILMMDEQPRVDAVRTRIVEIWSRACTPVWHG